MFDPQEALAVLYRAAIRATHPDAGGSATELQHVLEAKDTLESLIAHKEEPNVLEDIQTRRIVLVDSSGNKTMEINGGDDDGPMFLMKYGNAEITLIVSPNTEDGKPSPAIMLSNAEGTASMLYIDNEGLHINDRRSVVRVILSIEPAVGGKGGLAFLDTKKRIITSIKEGD